MKPIKSMTIRMSAEQAEELDTIAAVDGQPVSQVIRLAIAKHIEKRKREGSFQASLRKRIERDQRMLIRAKKREQPQNRGSRTGTSRSVT